MSSIERQYEYKARWTSLLVGATFSGTAAGVLGYEAASNDCGLVIYRLFQLSPLSATIFYWVLCILASGVVAIVALVVVDRLAHKRRIAFTPHSIILPKSRWSSEETAINFDEITAISVGEVSGQRFLHVLRADGAKFTIALALLPGKELFEEVCDLLCQRVEQVNAHAQIIVG